MPTSISIHDLLLSYGHENTERISYVNTFCMKKYERLTGAW